MTEPRTAASPAARTVLLLHPGAMGVTVGTTLRGGGHGVRWLEAGRSEATRQRARAGGLQPFASLDVALQGADAVVSVCPPAAALAEAERVASTGFTGLYVDANAVAPATARRLEALFGDRLVDGGIIGPPAQTAGTTRLYLSGPAAQTCAAWFAAGPLAAVALAGPAGAASALKMCYAAYTKGVAALLLAVRALARAEGVSAPLLAEWALSQPGLAERSAGAARGTAGKAWRFVGEMEEIAASFEAAGLPGDFHRAAAEVYRRMAPLSDITDSDGALQAAVGRLLSGPVAATPESR